MSLRSSSVKVVSSILLLGSYSKGLVSPPSALELSGSSSTICSLRLKAITLTTSMLEVSAMPSSVPLDSEPAPGGATRVKSAVCSSSPYPPNAIVMGTNISPSVGCSVLAPPVSGSASSLPHPVATDRRRHTTAAIIGLRMLYRDVCIYRIYCIIRL